MKIAVALATLVVALFILVDNYINPMPSPQYLPSPQQSRPTVTRTIWVNPPTPSLLGT